MKYIQRSYNISRIHSTAAASYNFSAYRKKNSSMQQTVEHKGRRSV